MSAEIPEGRPPVRPHPQEPQKDGEHPQMWSGSCWLCDYTGESDYPENCCPKCGGCAMEWW